MNTEVATTPKNTQVAHYQEQPGNEAILKTDVIIPRVLLMQGLSEFVSQRKAQMGDMVKSTTMEIIGTPDKAIQFIPLMHTNEWRMEEMINGKYEYRGVEARTARNETLPWEFEQNGAKWRRTKVINLYALLPTDVDAELAEIKRAQAEGDFDINKVLMPVVISFRSTGYNAGKTVVTHFAKAASMAQYGAKAYGYALTLKCQEDKNDKGTYYVFNVDVSKNQKVTKEQLAKAEEWYQILSTQKVQIHEAEDSEGTTEPMAHVV
jgi:hypothetical protein